MPTRFTSLGVAGTATIATLIATAVTLTTVTITTANITNANVSGTLEATTVSGSTLKTTDGTVNITNANGIDATTISGSTIRAYSVLSGATLRYNVPGAAIGNVPCWKSTGAMGYYIRTSTGFVSQICN